MLKPRICLSMIVKNEAPVIARCLASVLPVIDHWIICDTGSTDGTQDVIRKFFAEHGKPGSLHERHWKDFAHNRTEALELARPHGDYTLIIDADDVLVLPQGFKLPVLKADSYALDIVQLELRYQRTQLIRSALPWRYEGVLHEFLSYPDRRDGRRIFPENRNQELLPGVEIHMGHDGARRRVDESVRYARDAEVLASALASERDPFLISRYTFYLAQSHENAGDKEAALDGYLKRAQLGFWDQERYISLYRAGRLRIDLGHPADQILDTFSRAAMVDSARAEALHGAARYCREKGLYQRGYDLARQGLDLEPPRAALFAEDWIYAYGLLDEFAVNAYWVADYRGCIDACRRLLDLGSSLSDDLRARVAANERFARAKLGDLGASVVPQIVQLHEPAEDVQTETVTLEAGTASDEQPVLPAEKSREFVENLVGRTLHVLGVAHTIPHEDYMVCAFTAKVLVFPDIVQPFGWHVVEYSNEGSTSNAREHVVVLTRERLRALSRRTSREQPMDLDVDNKPLQEEYQRILLERIRARAKPGDIVCHVFGPNFQVFEALPQCHHIESSVGYLASPGLPFRIYESSAWMHWHHGKAGREDGHNYNWVVPSGFDVDAWPYCGEPEDYAIFLGRVTARKGIDTLIEIARRMPALAIHAYGPGDTSPWREALPSNLHFKGVILGRQKVEAVRRARCMLMPTAYIEPFGFSGIEAQLCGVPLIGTSFGAFQETIIDGVTGFRCHTLADWVAAIGLSASLDREQISKRARQRYSREAIGRQYDWVFRQLSDLSGRGWYGEISRKIPSFSSSSPAGWPSGHPAIITRDCTSDQSAQIETESTSIPKTIVQTSPTKPEPYLVEQMFRYCGKSWDFIHFTDEEATSYMIRHVHREFRNVVDKFHDMPTGAHKADLFRYYYLFLNGGVFIDSDATLKGNVDTVCRDVDFFTVRSGWVANTLFQGFMGTTAGNSIIYEALKDAYETKIEDIKNDYNIFCRSLDNIVNRNKGQLKVRLLDEVLYSNGVSEILDMAGNIVLSHHYGSKQIPKVMGTSWRPWNR